MARVQYLIVQGGGGGQGGGAIISHRHILTSAFALNSEFSVLNVWIGGVTRTSQRSVWPQRRVPHLNYAQNPRINDIGIIIMNADIPFDRFVQPIALPSSEGPYLNEQAVVLGFGGWPQNTNRDQLEAAFMRVVTPVRCNTVFPAHVVAQQFCAEDTLMRTDFCADDIGSPVVTLVRGSEVLVGIGSVHRCLANDLTSQPSLVTRVHAYRAWITAEAGV